MTFPLVEQAALRASESRIFSRLLTVLELAAAGHRDRLAVLTYHRVDWPDARPALSPRLISATPDGFECQMDFLASNYRVLSMPELLEIARTGGSPPPRAVLITFDDGYEDFAEHAWPVLLRYRLPATLFVPTAFPDDEGRTFWWDRLHAALSTTDRVEADTPFGRTPLRTPEERRSAFARSTTYVKSLPHDAAMAWVETLCRQLDVPPPEPAVLGWDRLRALKREGLCLGAHTRTHPMMNRVPLKEARMEATTSRRELERQTGEGLPIFAYPSGGFTPELVQALGEDGFELAFTTEGGVNRWGTARRLALRRWNVGGRSTLGTVRSRLLARAA